MLFKEIVQRLEKPLRVAAATSVVYAAATAYESKHEVDSPRPLRPLAASVFTIEGNTTSSITAPTPPVIIDRPFRYFRAEPKEPVVVRPKPVVEVVQPETVFEAQGVTVVQPDVSRILNALPLSKLSLVRFPQEDITGLIFTVAVEESPYAVQFVAQRIEEKESGGDLDVSEHINLTTAIVGPKEKMKGDPTQSEIPDVQEGSEFFHTEGVSSNVGENFSIESDEGLSEAMGWISTMTNQWSERAKKIKPQEASK